VVKTAWRIKETLPQVHCTLPVQFQLDYSMGIHTGEAILGMIGSEKRMEYTAVGDSVNVAKRLQESAEPGQILITANTYRIVKDQVMVKRLDPLLLRGRSETIEVFEVLGIKP
jgi:class 3 adenylate cyclase